MNELINKTTLTSILKKYDAKKGRVIQPVTALPTGTDVENRFYLISHEEEETESKSTTALDIIGSYAQMYSKGKYNVLSDYTLHCADYTDAVKSFSVSRSKVTLYSAADCSGSIATIKTSDVKTWSITTLVNHIDFYAGNKSAQTVSKIATVDRLEDLFISRKEKGSAGGVAVLDEDGKIPFDELSFSTLIYMGVSSDFATDVPAVTDPVNGMFFISGTEQTYNDETYYSGDWIIYNSTEWEKSSNTNTVSSVNEKIGAVVLTGEDIAVSSSDTTTVKASLDAKQETLTSGTNIKTINGESILGSGNLTAGGCPIEHAVTETTYGVGTETKYGHNKIVNNLTTTAYADGEVLSAYQGKLLADKTVVEGTRGFYNSEGTNAWNTEQFATYFIVDPANTTGTSLYLVSKNASPSVSGTFYFVANKACSLSSGTIKVYVNGVDSGVTITLSSSKSLSARYIYYATASGTTINSSGLITQTYNYTASLPNFALATGSRIRITFANACVSYDNYTSTSSYYPTLNVNGTGAKRIYVNKCGVLTPLTPKKFYGVAYYWQPYTTLELVYTGSYWLIANDTDLISYTSDTVNCRVKTDGLIRQFIKITNATNTTNTLCTFPITYTTAPMIVTADYANYNYTGAGHEYNFNTEPTETGVYTSTTMKIKWILVEGY